MHDEQAAVHIQTGRSSCVDDRCRRRLMAVPPVSTPYTASPMNRRCSTQQRNTHVQVRARAVMYDRRTPCACDAQLRNPSPSHIYRHSNGDAATLHFLPPSWVSVLFRFLSSTFSLFPFSLHSISSSITTSTLCSVLVHPLSPPYSVLSRSHPRKMFDGL